MVDRGEYSWNSGMFIWRVARILEGFQRQMPEFYAQLAEVEAALGMVGYEPTLSRVWRQVVKQTIDYGVMGGLRTWPSSLWTSAGRTWGAGLACWSCCQPMRR